MGDTAPPANLESSFAVYVVATDSTSGWITYATINGGMNKDALLQSSTANLFARTMIYARPGVSASILDPLALTSTSTASAPPPGRPAENNTGGVPVSTDQASRTGLFTLSSTQDTVKLLASTATPTVNIMTVTATGDRGPVSTKFVNTSPSANAASSTGGITTSVVSGIAVACFVIGLITSASIFWAITSRRRRRLARFPSSETTPTIAGLSDDSSNNGHTYVPVMPTTPNTAKELPPITEPIGHSHEGEMEKVAPTLRPALAHAATLPASAFIIKRKRTSLASASGLVAASYEATERSFSELRMQVKTMFEQLDMHVDNFYTADADRVQLSEDQRHHLQQLDSPYLPDTVIGLLPDASDETVKTLIKHCLAYAIFSRIDSASSKTDRDDTLLPTGLLAVLQVLQPFSPHNQDSEVSEQDTDRRTRWRHETIAMMDTAALSKSIEIKAKINKLAETCVKAIDPWSVRRYGPEARRSHLARIMEEAVEMGLRMFGERRGWLTWQWEVHPIASRAGHGQDTIVVSPGLELRKEPITGRTGSKADGESVRHGGKQEFAQAEIIFPPTTATIKL